MDRPAAPGRPTVTVWWAWCSRSLPLDHAVLSPAERARVDGLHRGGDRDRAALARVVLRHALAERLGQGAAEIAIDWARGPALDPSLGLWASVAHSHDGVAVALTEAGPLGVDVEALERGRDLRRDVRERVFTPAERDLLDALPAEDAERSALELWTVKEAVFKASGDRFLHAPATVEIARNGGAPRLLRFDERQDLIRSARLAVIAPPETGDPGYVGTVAVLGVDGLGALTVDARDAAELLPG